MRCRQLTSQNGCQLFHLRHCFWNVTDFLWPKEHSKRLAPVFVGVMEHVCSCNSLHEWNIRQWSYRESFVHQAIMDKHIGHSKQCDSQPKSKQHGTNYSSSNESKEAQTECRNGIRNCVDIIGLKRPCPWCMMRLVKRPSRRHFMPPDSVRPSSIHLHAGRSTDDQHHCHSKLQPRKRSTLWLRKNELEVRCSRSQSGHQQR